MIRLRTLLAALPLLGACAAPPAAAPPGGRLEPLYTYSLTPRAFRFTVTSTGCTRAGDFRLDLRPAGEVCEVRLYRLRPDLCKAAPRPVTLQLPWDPAARCGTRPLRVINPYRSPARVR